MGKNPMMNQMQNPMMNQMRNPMMNQMQNPMMNQMQNPMNQMRITTQNNDEFKNINSDFNKKDSYDMLSNMIKRYNNKNITKHAIKKINTEMDEEKEGNENV